MRWSRVAAEGKAEPSPCALRALSLSRKGRGRSGCGIGLWKKSGEQRRDGFDVALDSLRCDAAQAHCEAAFVFAVATQVQQAMFQGERRGCRLVFRRWRCGDEARGGELLPPCLRFRPRQIGIDQLPRLRGVETRVALRDRQRGQRGGGEHFVRRGRIEPLQGAGQRVVERAQCAEAVEFAQQAHVGSPVRAEPLPQPSAA